MSLRHYLHIVIGVCLASFSFLFLVIYNFTPDMGWIFTFLFYSTLFLSLLSSLFLINFAIRLFRFYKNQKVLGKEINKSFQLSLCTSLIAIIMLILQSFRVLTWWNAAILILIFLLIQYILRFSRTYK
jgi:hypothetical protein